MGEKAIPFSLWILSALTLVVMAWLCFRGPIWALAGFMVGKHLLIAILAGGLGVDATGNLPNRQG